MSAAHQSPCPARAGFAGAGEAGVPLPRGGTPAPDQGRASMMRLNGVWVATRTRVKPASFRISPSRLGPACAPSPSPTSCARLGGRHLEGEIGGVPRGRRGRARAVDRRGVIVEAGEAAVREGLSQDDGGGAVAAADVGDLGASLEPLDRAVERGQPFLGL